MICIYMNHLPSLVIGYDGSRQQFYLQKEGEKKYFKNIEEVRKYFLDRHYTEDSIEKLRVNLKRAFEMLNFFNQFSEEEIYD